MIRKILYALLTLFCCTHALYAQRAEQKAEPDKWLTSWLLCGPIHLTLETKEFGWFHCPDYHIDYLKEYGGETALTVKAGDVVKYPKGTATWKYYSTPDSIINLKKVVSPEVPLLAYAYTEVISDKDQTMVISFGTADGGTLFVNGKQVWDHSLRRLLRTDSEWIPIALKKGRNKILFKVEQLGETWEFCAKLLPYSSSELIKREQVLRIDTFKDGEIRVGSPYSEEILRQLIKKASIKVENIQGKTVWSTNNISDFSARLQIPSGESQRYMAHFDVELQSGEKTHFHQWFRSGPRRDFELFANGKTNYTIALDPSASESEKWAADELRHWLKEISGADFPIIPLAQSKSPRIVVGYNQVTAFNTGAKRPEDFDETYYYLNKDADIYIYGGKQRGTMYGVLSFLENELGTRWYTPKVTVAPKRDRYTFEALGRNEKPGIRVRNNFYFEAFDPIWAARNKMNGSMSLRNQPGGMENYWGVHTFYPLVPPEEFFEKHPEYYSLINGKRVGHNAQLCLSNPEVLEIVKDRIKKKIRENPGHLIYDVSQNDFYDPCQCDQCQKIVQEEGSESGPIIRFVNQVAEDVEKEFPDKFIGTLAYQYTRAAPKKVKPRKNVVVRLCSIECCFAHDFESCPMNEAFLKDLNDWGQRSPHLYIWDYVVNFGHYLMPYPNFAALQPNMKAFQKNNSIGVMSQAAYQSRGAEFAELRAYVLAKLLWNPDADVPTVIDDFMTGYYGRSGTYVKQYFDKLHELITPDTHIGLGTMPSDKIYTERFIQESLALFDKACKVADNEDIKRRVDLAKLPVIYLKCRRTPVLARNDGTYDEFIRITKLEDVKYYAEPGDAGVEEFHRYMKEAK